MQAIDWIVGIQEDAFQYTNRTTACPSRKNPKIDGVRFDILLLRRKRRNAIGYQWTMNFIPSGRNWIQFERVSLTFVDRHSNQMADPALGRWQPWSQPYMIGLWFAFRNPAEWWGGCSLVIVRAANGTTEIFFQRCRMAAVSCAFYRLQYPLHRIVRKELFFIPTRDLFGTWCTLSGMPAQAVQVLYRNRKITS